MLLGLLLVIQILVCAALVGVILLQRSEGGALGVGSSGSGGFMTARGAGDLLTRTTAILAALFFILSLALTILSGHEKGASSVVDRLKVDALNPDALAKPTAPPANATAPGQPAPGAPAPPPSNVFQAPAPQVNTAPSTSVFSTPGQPAQGPAAPAAPKAAAPKPAPAPTAAPAAPAPAQGAPADPAPAK